MKHGCISRRGRGAASVAFRSCERTPRNLPDDGHQQSVCDDVNDGVRDAFARSTARGEIRPYQRSDISAIMRRRTFAERKSTHDLRSLTILQRGVS